MLGPPIDAWYVWLGVAMVSLAILGVAVVATPASPSTATAAAETIEQVAASRPPTTGTHAIDAERVRVGEARIALEGDGTDEATIDHGRMTPAQRGTDLRRVALGEAPEEAFTWGGAFQEAAAEARSTERIIEPAGDELIVRKVIYDGEDVLLVTA